MVAQTEVLAGQVEQGLAEFGDDPARYADAKSRKNYSGMSPITKASGTRRVVLARYARRALAITSRAVLSRPAANHGG